MMAGLIYHWSGKPSKLTFEIIEKAYRLPDILRWCRRLVRVLAEAKAILIWDRLQAHRSKVVKAFLAAHGVEVVLLPGTHLSSTPPNGSGPTSKVANSPTSVPKTSRMPRPRPGVGPGASMRRILCGDQETSEP